MAIRNKMFCSNCGKQLPDNLKFCTGCGKKLAQLKVIPLSSDALVSQRNRDIGGEDQKGVLSVIASVLKIKRPDIPYFNEIQKKAVGELLSSLSIGKPLELSYIQSLSVILGDLNLCTEHFLKQGLLINAGYDKKLSNKFKVPDLKGILERKKSLEGVQIKIKGKKADLIELVMQNCSKEELEKLVEGEICYQGSPLGNQLVKQYLEELKIERDRMEEDVLLYLSANKANEAAMTIDDYRARQPHSSNVEESVFKCSSCIHLVPMVNFILNYPLDELPYTIDQKNAIRLNFSVSELLGESCSDTAKRILNATSKNFICESIDEYLVKEMKGDEYLDEVLNDPIEKCMIFVLTITNKARNQHFLDELRRDMATLDRKFYLGVEISTIEDAGSCSMCIKGQKKYKWSEINRIPILPRHWGCRCDYSYWLKDE